VKLGPHRDDPGRAPPHYDEDTAGSFDDVAASHKAQVGPDQSRPRPEGDQPRGTLASGNGGLGVGEGQVGRELGLAVGGLGPLAPERDRAWRGTKGRRKNNFPLSGSQSPGADGVVAVGLGVVMADR
jgi:hypothetical protein